jgi:glucuronokinase
LFHAELRRRHDSDDPVVRDGMARLAELAAEARDALVAGDRREFGRCMDGSFDVRSEMAGLEPGHVRMIELARSLGAAANFAGSGGAIVGTMPPGIEPAEVAAAFASEACAATGPVRMNWDG